MRIGTVSKLEFYLAPFGLNLDHQAPGFTQTGVTQWRAHWCVALCKRVYVYVHIYVTLGMLPTHVFCLERTIFQTPGMKRRSNLLAFQKSLWPQKG